MAKPLKQRPTLDHVYIYLVQSWLCPFTSRALNRYGTLNFEERKKPMRNSTCESSTWWFLHANHPRHSNGTPHFWRDDVSRCSFAPRMKAFRLCVDSSDIPTVFSSYGNALPSLLSLRFNHTNIDSVGQWEKLREGKIVCFLFCNWWKVGEWEIHFLPFESFKFFSFKGLNKLTFWNSLFLDEIIR